MLNKFKEINWNPSLVELRKFGVTLLIGLPFTALFWYLIISYRNDVSSPTVAYWILQIGLPIAFAIVCFPVLGGPIYRIWFFLICVIETVLVNVLFTSFYFIVISPVAFFRRLKGSARMKKLYKSDVKTYWKDCEKITDLKRYYRQF